MKKNNLIFVFIVCFWGVGACNNKSKDQGKYKGADYGGTDDNGIDHQYIFDDGEYCAEVKYYNSNSGKTSTLILPVEIEDNKLVKIKFTNGGWLDDTHFTPPLPNEDQYFEFTDDRGYKYDVALLNDDLGCDN